MKTCNECGKSKPDSEYFSVPSYQCKPCKRELDRARYAPIKAAVKAKRLEVYKGNLKRCNTCHEYKPASEYHPHPSHWDRLSHECRTCKGNKSRQYYYANHERMLKKNKRDYKLNKKARRAKHGQWRKDNPDKAHAIWHRYRSHKLDVGGSFSSEQWNSLVKFYTPDSRCLCCNKKHKLNKDHVVPLSKGGTNTIGNIQPICKPCNSAKNTHATDYRPDAGAFARSLE